MKRLYIVVEGQTQAIIDQYDNTEHNSPVYKIVVLFL